MNTYYVDGTFVESEKAVLPLSDLAILRGYGVFDYMRTYGGKAFHLDAHVKRLMNSARLIGLGCPWSFNEIGEIVRETLARNDELEATLRLLITGGDSADSITPGQNPRLVVMVAPVKEFPPQWYETGVKVITTNITRYVPGAKSIDYIRAIISLNTARETGAVESLYVADNKLVLEGTTSNVFAVIDGQLATPRDEILPGVTRDVVLDITKPVFDTQLRTITRDELYRAEEVFLTSSNKEVLPVRQVDDRMIGEGKPGDITRKVQVMFKNYTEEYSRTNDKSSFS